MTSLENLLQQRRSAIVARWLDLVLETYPAETAKFLRSKKDQFANPVGHAISQGVEALFDELLQGVDRDRACLFLDNIIRIRAIQDFTPSQAVGFVFLLKGVIREKLGRELRDAQLAEELVLFECRIDDLALLSFDIFMKCREKLYEIRVNDMKRMFPRAFRSLVCKVPEELDKGDGNADNAT